MARPTLCVSCATLPIKDRQAATRVQQCPECRSNIGITSYGVSFRLTPVHRLITPGFMQNALIGSVICALVFAGAAVRVWMSGSVLEEAAPIEVKVLGQYRLKQPTVLVNDPSVPGELRHVPEVAVKDFPEGRTAGEANNQMQELMAQIRQENRQKQDGFLLAHLERRPELRGLPFIMGDACKLDPNQGQAFQTSVQNVRAAVDLSRAKPGQFFTQFNDIHTDAGIAALTQILGPESEGMRTNLARQLASSNNKAATRTLARAAIFDASGEVRLAAIKGLKGRPGADYSDIFLHGMRYPLPAVARRTAQAIIELQRTDLLPQLADYLGEAAPGDPVEAKVDNVPVHVVREVVRINHHRNCYLCHAPVETGSASEVPALVPSPGTPFPRLAQEYYGGQAAVTGLAIRADTTYLRQDFSVMLPVANAAPWPEMQRFDFLVRTRVVADGDLAKIRANIAARPANYLSENHKAALAALRELTGQDAGVQPEAWRRVLENR